MGLLAGLFLVLQLRFRILVQSLILGIVQDIIPRDDFGEGHGLRSELINDFLCAFFLAIERQQTLEHAKGRQLADIDFLSLAFRRHVTYSFFT